MAKQRNNRTAGHTYERQLAAKLRRFFPNLVTSRSANRSRDAQGIDFVNKDEYVQGRLPLNIQAKNVVLGRLPYVQVLHKMPKEPGTINLIYHQATRRTGGRFMPVGEFVFMSSEDFEHILSVYLAAKTQP